MATSRTRITSTSPALRRRPKQQRGQRRVEQILHHAEIAFSEVGFEQTTTNLIAERAGVSIGSLYQFFASKEAILEAMAERYLSQTLEALQTRMAATESLNVSAIVRDLLELMVKLQERRPYFLQCLTGNRPSPPLNQAVLDLNAAVADHVVLLLRRFGAKGTDDELRLQARICVETMGVLLPFVVYSRGKIRKQASLEIEKLLVGYIRRIVPEEVVA